jgi:hypothetical protein
MAFPLENTTIPVGFVSGLDKHEYAFRTVEVPIGYSLYLEDKLTGEFHDLNVDDYYFRNDANFRIDRFVLHFNKTGAPISAVTPESIAWGTPNGIKMTFNNMQSLFADVQVTNSIGQVIYTATNIETTNDFEVAINDPNPQVYIVTIVTPELTQSLKVVR